MQENRKKRYSRDFKVGVVKLITVEGRKIADVTKELGVSNQSIYAWIKEFAADPTDAFPGSGKLKPNDDEVRKLREELRITRMERDLLKKTMGYFVERPK